MYIYGSAELFQTVSVILSTPAADRRALQAALMSTRCALTFLNTNKLHTSHHLLLCASDLILKCQDLVFFSLVTNDVKLCFCFGLILVVNLLIEVTFERYKSHVRF